MINLVIIILINDNYNNIKTTIIIIKIITMIIMIIIIKIPILDKHNREGIKILFHLVKDHFNIIIYLKKFRKIWIIIII
jgi:hypothetical protein